MSLATLPMTAQETYENAKLLGEDLNGTARYVGMGGAMEALGADISTISSNPAGIGLFRRSAVSASFGLKMQGGNQSFDGQSKTTASFDQIGFVISTQTRRNSFLNFSFNFHKGKNFNQILSASNRINSGSSQNLSFQKGARGNVSNGGFDPALDKNNEYIGYENPKSDRTAQTFSQTDYLNWNVFIPTKVGTEDVFGYCDASDYTFGRKTAGYIGNYDFNVSGNIHDIVYLGIDFGIKDVRYKDYSIYDEALVSNGAADGNATYSDERQIRGTGFDVALGVIVRPIENSPFRFGVSVKTPTWYNLTTENYTTVKNTSKSGLYDNGKIREAYDFKLYTPWKFGVSLGHTVGNYLALGASFDYEDYGAADTRINDGVIVDGRGAFETNSRDRVMKAHTERTLKGVSTFKVGAEIKAAPEVAIRVGYNYVSPAYNSNAQKDMTLESPGTYYASATDFTNWKATNRFTCGIGYAKKGFHADLAFQYAAQKGDFYPFQSLETTYTDADNATQTAVCNPGATEVTNNRSQLLLTVGYRF